MSPGCPTVSLHDGAYPATSERPCRSGSLDTSSLQVGECFLQSRTAPVHDMIVRENAAVDLCRGQARGIGGMHAVVNPFRVVILASSNAGLERSAPGARIVNLELLRGFAPDAVVSR